MRFPSAISWFLPWLFALASIPAGGAETAQLKDDIELTADEPLTIDGRSGEMVARKNARVTYDTWTLVADEIRINRQTRDARAIGNVVATSPGMRLLARSARYNQATGRIEVRDFRFGRPPYYATGESGEGTAEAMVFENVQIFYGEPGWLTPRLTVRVLKVDRTTETFDAEGLKLSVGSLPVLALSGLARPLAGPSLFLETRAGYDNELGLHLGAGVYYPHSAGWNPGGSVDIFSDRGILLGPGARYDIDRETKLVKGGGDLLYIHDYGDRGVDRMGDPIDDDRTFATWSHIQTDRERWSLNGEINWWSDSAVLRDFREEAFDRSQEPDNFLEASLNGKNYILSAFTRYRANDFQIVAERLPEVRFDLLPTPIADTGTLFAIESSAAILREKPVDGGPELRSDRFDLYTGLERTFKVARGVNFTPVAGGRLTHYSRAIGGRDDNTRWLGEIGFDASAVANRVFEIEKLLLGINGVRHIIEPALQYRYVPSADRGRAFIPAIDRPAFLTQLQPLGLAQRRDIDALDEIHAVRLGLNNLVHTRREGYGSRQLLMLNLAGDLYFSDHADGRDYSTVQAELRLTPADWLDWWVFMRFDPEDINVPEFNTRLTLVNGDAWSAGIDGDYLTGDLSQIELFGRYALNEAYEVFGGVRYDAREERFNEINFGLNSQIAQNWLVRTGIALRDGPRRESSFSLRLSLRFLAF
ncbi:MAG: LPS-assembly protein LptD [Opitutaceae bacterium]